MQSLSLRHRVARMFGGARPDKREIRFLHIGKTAGSQMANVIAQINRLSDEVEIRKHGHNKYLRHLPDDSQYFFGIRHPVTRFCSGFYSRKRKGQPRNFREHSIYDSFAFDTFDHANDLAEALFEEGARGIKAAAAIKSIMHTAHDQFEWFARSGAFLFVRPPVHIIRQEHFDADLKVFFDRAGLGEVFPRIEFLGDETRSHRNDYSSVPPLSEKAKSNLRRWYSQDFEFYRMCEAWIEGDADWSLASR